MLGSQIEILRYGIFGQNKSSFMKTILAVLFAILAIGCSMACGFVMISGLSTDGAGLPAVAIMVFGLLSYLLWKSRPNALWLIEGRKKYRTYWWVPTISFQKFFLQRLVQKRKKKLRTHTAHPLTLHLSRTELNQLQTELMIYSH